MIPFRVGMLELCFIFGPASSSYILLQFSLGIESVQSQDRDKTRMYTRPLPSCPRTNRPSCSNLHDPVRQGMICFGLFSVKYQMNFVFFFSGKGSHIWAREAFQCMELKSCVLCQSRASDLHLYHKSLPFACKGSP